MYSKIYDFCSVKNVGNARLNGKKQPPRVQWLIKFIESLNIEWELDEWSEDGETNFYNIILPGSSGKWISAHHDISNPKSDNANDNSCSVINAIMTKLNSNSTNVVLLDGEEIGGVGSKRASEKMKSGSWGNVDWVLNFELTGKGGDNFFVGNYENSLNRKIIEMFDCPVVNTPFNDAVVFNKNGIISTVINPLPPLDFNKGAFEKRGKLTRNKISSILGLPHNDEEVQILNHRGVPLDIKILYNCHTLNDSLDTISPTDMKKFVENVVLKIV